MLLPSNPFSTTLAIGSLLITMQHNMLVNSVEYDLLSGTGRCLASMVLFDADNNRYLNANEFANVYQDMGGCSAGFNVYRNVACMCRMYSGRRNCCQAGVALLGIYPSTYSNAVCYRMREAIQNERCNAGIVVPPEAAEASEKVGTVVHVTVPSESLQGDDNNNTTAPIQPEETSSEKTVISENETANSTVLVTIPGEPVAAREEILTDTREDASLSNGSQKRSQWYIGGMLFASIVGVLSFSAALLVWRERRTRSNYKSKGRRGTRKAPAFTRQVQVIEEIDDEESLFAPWKPMSDDSFLSTPGTEGVEVVPW